MSFDLSEGSSSDEIAVDLYPYTFGFEIFVLAPDATSGATAIAAYSARCHANRNRGKHVSEVT